MEEAWEGLFTNKVLERGKLYYIEGRVELLSYENTYLTAEVYGTEYYNVTIEITENFIKGMNCDCPYAVNHKYCKHMAAVLYSVENSNLILADDNSEFKGIDSLIDSVPENKIKEFLKEVLENDMSLRREFKFRYKGELSKEDQDFYRNKIHLMFNFNYDFLETDYIEILDNLEINLLEFIEEDVEELLNHEKYPFIFELFKKIYNRLYYLIENYNNEDTEEYFNEIGRHSFKVLNKLLNCDIQENLKDEIFNWAMERLDENISSKLNRYLESIVIYKFNSPFYILEKNAFADRKLEEYKENTNSDDFKNTIEFKYKILKSEGANKKKINRVLSKYNYEIKEERDKIN